MDDDEDSEDDDEDSAYEDEDDDEQRWRPPPPQPAQQRGVVETPVDRHAQRGLVLGTEPQCFETDRGEDGRSQRRDETGGEIGQ